MALFLGILVVGLALFVLGVAVYLWAVKDHYVEVDDVYTKDMIESFKHASTDKQDLVKEILEDD